MIKMTVRDWSSLDSMFQEAFGCSTHFCDTLPIREDKDRTLILRYDVPGFSKDDLEVQLDKDVLSIKGKKGHRKIDAAWKVKEALDAESINAKIEYGELVLTIVKGNKVRKIEVT